MTAQVKVEDDEAGPSHSQPAGSDIVHEIQSRDLKDVLVAPVYGVKGANSAVCSLLRIEGLLCLLDCGWTEDCDPALLEPLASVAPHVDLVLISHADIYHAGALPYAVAHLGLRAKVYATLPVRHMGQLSLYELLASKQDAQEFDLFTFDDIDTAFEQVEGVRFMQQIVHGGEGPTSVASDNQSREGPRKAAVRFTAHPAGHSLGGAMWHISVQNQDFLYAVSIALKNDNHLRGCTAQNAFHRPALLITDAVAASRIDPPKEQAHAFAAAVVDALRTRRGHVVIPVDVAARVLELLVILEGHWRQAALSYPIVLLAKTGYSMLSKAKVQLEFLSEKVQRNFSRGRGGNPLDLKHVHVLGNIEALNTVPNRENIVVLAPLPSLEHGLARELLFNFGWASDPNNTIILPFGAGAPGTLAAKLAAQTALARKKAPLDLDLEIHYRVDLTSEEVAERRAAEEAAAQAAATAAGADNDENEGKNGAAAKDVDMDEDEDDAGVDGLATGRVNTASIAQRGAAGGETHAAGDAAAGVAGGDGRGVAAAAHGSADPAPAFAGVLIDGFKLPPGAVAPMFPFIEPPPPADAFGAQVDLHALCGRTYYDDDDALPAGLNSGMGDLEPDLDLLPFLEQRPTKVVTERRRVRVAAELRVFDFASLISDSAFHSFARAVAPRNLVLLRRPAASDAAESLFLAGLDEYLRGLFVRVHAPAAQAVLTLPSTACYVASLTPALAASMKAAELSAAPMGPYRFDWLDAVVSGHDHVTGNPVFDEPAATAVDQHSAANVFFGGMMVSDVTRRLKEGGLEVEQEGECAIVAGGAVLVRQEGPDKPNELVIEGALSPLYFQVREAVYQQYRLVK